MGGKTWYVEFMAIDGLKGFKPNVNQLICLFYNRMEE